MVNHTQLHLAARNHALALGTLPAARAWENVAFTPTADTPYIVEQYEPGATSKVGITLNGTLDVLPLYVLQVWGPTDVGISTLSGLADDLIEHFAPGTPLTLDNGDVARVRGRPAPTRSALTSPLAGWAVVTVTIPLILSTPNSI